MLNQEIAVSIRVNSFGVYLHCTVYAIVFIELKTTVP